MEVHKNAKCAVNKINNSADGLPASSTALTVLFDGWESWTIYAGVEAKQFMVQMIKDINAQVIEDRSLLLPLFLRSFCVYFILHM